MNKLKNIACQHPMFFSLTIIICSTIFTEIHLEKYLKNSMGLQSASYLSGIFEQGICSILLIALLSGLGFITNAGFTNPKEWKQLWIVWPVILLSILSGWSFFKGNMVIDTSKPILIMLFILLFLSTGFLEEILFRGAVLTMMLQKWGNTRKGIYLSVLVSNLLFGLSHITNFLMGRYTLLSAGAQILYAMFFGVFMAACLLRTRSIWIIILLHAVLDTCGNLPAITVNGNLGMVQVYQTTIGEAISSILIFLPLLFGGLFMLRKVQPKIFSPSIQVAGFFRKL